MTTATLTVATAAVDKGAILWNADGLAVRVVTWPAGDGTAVVRYLGERDPLRVPLAGWRLALPCDYCDRPATAQLKHGQPDEVLCRTCSHDHYERPADWVREIPRRDIRRLYEQCQPAG